METKLYIGSNNVTNVLELDKIELILNQYHDGYTIVQGDGYWKGSKEKVAIVTICGDLVSEDLLEELKRELFQESIMLHLVSILDKNKTIPLSDRIAMYKIIKNSNN